MSAGSGPSTLPDARAGNWVDAYAPRSLRPYLRLTRLDRPVGWWLLLLPCWWSAGLAAGASGHAFPNLWHALLFLIGAVTMRGAGCTFNDIIDRDLDAQVARTRSRPLPAGDISVRQAVAWLALLCCIGLAVLLQFNWFTVVLGASSLIVVAIYPFMKRVMGMPQIVLGLAFSWGALVGWSAVFGSLALAPVLLYAAAVFWTVGYDTIYAMQDLEDDAIVGIRSSARTFAGHTQLGVAGCYAAAVLCAGGAAYTAEAGLVAYLGVALFAAHLARQVRRVPGADPRLALTLFRSNRDAGLILAAGFALDALSRASL